MISTIILFIYHLYFLNLLNIINYLKFNYNSQIYIQMDLL